MNIKIWPETTCRSGIELIFVGKLSAFKWRDYLVAIKTNTITARKTSFAKGLKSFSFNCERFIYVCALRCYIYRACMVASSRYNLWAKTILHKYSKKSRSTNIWQRNAAAQNFAWLSKVASSEHTYIYKRKEKLGREFRESRCAICCSKRRARQVQRRGQQRRTAPNSSVTRLWVIVSL